MTQEEMRIEAPRMFGHGGDATEQYTDAADTLERHENYETKKGLAVPYEMTLTQYVAYCRKRAEENYTNEMVEEAQARFEKFWKLLNG